MALLNPVYGLIVPFLFVVTIPLAILAGITTTFAFSVLMFRVVVVYIDIAVNMVPQYVIGRRVIPLSRGYVSSLITTTSATSNIPPPSPTDGSSGSGLSSPSSAATSRPVAPVARHHRRRRTSAASFNSVESLAPIEDNGKLVNAGSKRNSSVVMSSIGMDRDFEGVGGWRIGAKCSADDDSWTRLNSRLELPLDHQRRHHHRSPSGGGATTPGGSNGDWLMMKSSSETRSKDRSPESASKRGRERREKENAKGGCAMSPNSSRVRTPTNMLPPPLTTLGASDESYFPLTVSPKIGKRPI